MISVKKVTEQADLNTVFRIREEVFVEEQQVSREEEYDEFENTSQHYLASYDNTPCATARWRHTDKGVKLERFAVLAPYRNKNVGSKVLEQVLRDVTTQAPGKTVYLHAQLPAVQFYERQGFEKKGDIFLECDIKHYKMVLRQ